MVAVYAVLPALLFPDALLRGRVFYDRDVHLLWYAQAQTFVRAVAGGAWPLWNPFPAFGQPLLALANNEAAYPFTWLNLVLPPGPYYTAFVVAHVLLGGLGTYAFGRQLGLSRPAAASAGLLWSACGPLLCLVNVWNQLGGMAYLPWTFVAGDRAGRTVRAADAALWGAALAGALLAGSPEAAALGGMGSAVFALRHRRLGRLAAISALAVVFAAGFAAVQWWPTLDVAARSARGQLDEEARAYWSVHPASLADVTLPLFLHQWPLTPAQRAALFESRDPFLVSLYLGLPTVGLLVASGAARRHAAWRLLALVGLAALLSALGRHTPLFEALGWAVPPLRALRYPVKAMTLVAFCWAMLAGFGVESWRSGFTPRLRAAVAVVTGVVAAAALVLAAALWTRADTWGPRLLAASAGVSLSALLAPVAVRAAVAGMAGLLVAVLAVLGARRTRPAAWAAAAVLVCVLELAWAHRDLNPTAPAAFYSYRSPVASRVLAEPHGRVYTFDYFIAGEARKHLARDTGFLFAHPERWPYPWAGALALRTYLLPPVIAAWGLESGFERDPTALYSAHAMDLARRLRQVDGTPAHTRLLRLGGVTHVVSLHEAGLEDLVPAGVFESPFPEAIRLFRVPDPMPGAFAVGGTRVLDGPAAVEALTADAFDPLREVVLADGRPVPAPPEFASVVHVLTRRFDRVEIDANLSSEGHVVLLDGYDPGWRATVDGRPAPVLRANVAFRAVPVPAGHHRIELRYRPRPVLGGLAVSLVTLLTAIILAARLRAHGRVSPTA